LVPESDSGVANAGIAQKLGRFLSDRIFPPDEPFPEDRMEEHEGVVRPPNEKSGQCRKPHQEFSALPKMFSKFVFFSSALVS
jgi:hypothetical protein